MKKPRTRVCRLTEDAYQRLLKIASQRQLKEERLVTVAEVLDEILDMQDELMRLPVFKGKK